MNSPVTEELLQEAVRQILSVGSPEKIVLFGSWARGQARPDSDLDLLIIRRVRLAALSPGRTLPYGLTGPFPR
jgi:uncharacterized protein